MFTALKITLNQKVTYPSLWLNFIFIQKNFLVSILKVQIPEISISIYKQVGLMLSLLYAVLGSWLLAVLIYFMQAGIEVSLSLSH